MTLDPGVAFFLLAIVFVALFLVVMLPLVALANQAIGARYEQRAAQIAPRLAAEGLRYAEDGVRVRATFLGALAVGVHWSHADVRITSRAVYLLQYTRMFGIRIGRPILAFPLGGAILDPFVASSVSMGWLSRYPEEDGGAIVLKGGIAVQRFTMRLSVRDARAFLAATG